MPSLVQTRVKKLVQPVEKISVFFSIITINTTIFHRKHVLEDFEMIRRKKSHKDRGFGSDSKALSLLTEIDPPPIKKKCASIFLYVSDDLESNTFFLQLK